MEFKYIVKVETKEWSETKPVEGLKDNSYFKQFSNINPFIARKEAFLHAKSFEENFFEAEKAGTDYFLKSKDGVHKEFIVSVSLLNENTNEEIEIHINSPFDEDGLNMGFVENSFYLNSVIPQLENEVDYLKKQKVDLVSQIKKLNLIDKTTKEQRIIEIIPTEFINKEKIEFIPISKLL